MHKVKIYVIHIIFSIAFKIVQNILQNNCRSEMPYTRMKSGGRKGKKKGGNWLKHKMGNIQIKLVTRNKTKE